MVQGVGVRNPKRSVWISAGIVAIATAMIGVGVLQGGLADTEPSLAGGLIGVGLVVLTIGIICLWNFSRAVRLMAEIARGEGVIARWTVTADEMISFREAESRREARGAEMLNAWRPPKAIPAAGIEIRFADDAVIIGEDYFGLAAHGFYTFRGVELIAGAPPVLAFTLKLVATQPGVNDRIVESTGPLRVPVASGAASEARTALRHFEDVLSGRVVANPGFWPSRMKLGIWGLGLGVLCGAAGFAMIGMKLTNGAVGNVALVLAIAGVLVALGGGMLAAIAYFIGVRGGR